MEVLQETIPKINAIVADTMPGMSGQMAEDRDAWARPAAPEVCRAWLLELPNEIMLVAVVVVTLCRY